MGHPQLKCVNACRMLALTTFVPVAGTDFSMADLIITTFEDKGRLLLDLVSYSIGASCNDDCHGQDIHRALCFDHSI